MHGLHCTTFSYENDANHFLALNVCIQRYKYFKLHSTGCGDLAIKILTTMIRRDVVCESSAIGLVFCLLGWLAGLFRDHWYEYVCSWIGIGSRIGRCDKMDCTNTEQLQFDHIFFLAWFCWGRLTLFSLERQLLEFYFGFLILVNAGQ